MPIQSLPSEIVAAIIECIPSKKDLSSISRTSTYFLSLARPILFSNIRFPRVSWVAAWKERRAKDLEPGARKESCDPRDYTDLISFLTSAPQLASFIRSLTLWGNPLKANSLRIDPMEIEVFNNILSTLPSLKTLCLHNVQFTASNTAVPYRYGSIDRLILSRTLDPWDMMKPLALFTQIQELELDPVHFWERPGPSSSFEEILYQWGISDILPTHIQASNIHLKSLICGSILEMLRRTRTPRELRSFQIHSTNITLDCYPSSPLLDFLCESAPTLTHITLGTGYPKRSDDQCAYREFDSQAMQARLAPFTSLLSLTLKVHSATWMEQATNHQLLTCYETFARMVPILASFPPCLRRITFSFARAKPWVYTNSTGASWLSPDLSLRPLVPLLQRYAQLEIVAFEGDDVMQAAEKERILRDLPEFRDLIRFIDGKEIEAFIPRNAFLNV